MLSRIALMLCVAAVLAVAGEAEAFRVTVGLPGVFVSVGGPPACAGPCFRPPPPVAWGPPPRFLPPPPHRVFIAPPPPVFVAPVRPWRPYGPPPYFRPYGPRGVVVIR